MTISVQRKRQPRRAGINSNGYTMEEEYLIWGVTDQLDALVAVGDDGNSDDLPSVGDTYTIEDYPMVVDRLEAVEFDDDDTRWTVKVFYVADRKDSERYGNAVNTALSSFSFDTGSATKNITQALTETSASRSFAKSGEKAPLSGGLIGWDGEKAQGVDIEVGAFKFSVTRKYSESEISKSYIKELATHAHKVNSTSYSLWDAGELEFVGAQGRYSPPTEAKSSGDGAGQLGGFSNITGTDANNTYNGSLFVSFKKEPGIFLPGPRTRFTLVLYKKPDLSAASEVARADLASVGVNELNDVNGSGIGGTITIYHYVTDTDSISIQFPFPWEITYNFAVSPNVTDLAVGDVAVSSKQGWQYADVRYAEEEQTVDEDKYLVQAAKYVYVHDVKDTVDLDFLELDEDDVIP